MSGRVTMDIEKVGFSRVANDAAWALMILQRGEQLDSKEEEKQLAGITGGLELIKLLELAEQFVLKTKGTTPEENDAYYSLRKAFSIEKLVLGDLGYEEVQNILNLDYTKILWRISKLREGVKEKLERVLKTTPEKLSEEEWKTCGEFFNMLSLCISSL